MLHRFRESRNVNGLMIGINDQLFSLNNCNPYGSEHLTDVTLAARYCMCKRKYRNMWGFNVEADADLRFINAYYYRYDLI